MKNLIIIFFAFTICFNLSAQNELENLDINKLHGVAAFDAKNYAEAEMLLTETLQTGGFDVELLLKRGIARLEQGKAELALADFNRAESKKKNIATLYMAKCYAIMNEPGNATNELEKHLKSKYKIAKSDIKLDSAFRLISETQEWKQLWMKDWYNSYEFTLSEADYAISREKYNEAYDILDPMLLRGSKKHAAYFIRAEALIENGDYKTALKDLKRAVRIRRYESKYIEKRAEVYFELGKQRKALKDYNTLIDKNPYVIDYYFHRAKVNEKLGNYIEAIDDILVYTSYFDDDANALYLAGNCYAQTNNYIDALQYYSRTLANEQSEANFFYARGKTYMNTETYFYAAKDFSMALDLTPNNPEIYFNRGISRIKLGKQKSACYDFRRAEELGYLPAYDYIKKYCTNYKK